MAIDQLSGGKETVLHQMKKLLLRRWPIFLAGLTALCVAGWWFFLRPTPERVARQGLAALEGQDTKTLVELAEPEEIEKLHLTPEIVKAILRETLWTTDFTKTRHHLTYQWVSRNPDVKGYAISPLPPAPQFSPPRPQTFWLISLQSPDGSWHLNLSHVLRNAIRYKNGRGSSKIYYRYMEQYGINGSRDQNGPYMSMAQFRRDLRIGFPKEASNWPP